MRVFHKNITLLVIIWGLLCLTNGCASLKQGKNVTKKIAEPILVSRDADYMIWCGNDALIYAYNESEYEGYFETEIYWYDVHTGRKVMVGKESDDYNNMLPVEATNKQQTEEEEEGQETGNYFIFPMACTPDGKWLVYLNKGRIRHGVLDVWRYEVSTGRHERIAISHDVASFDEGILSPDGKKLFLGRKPAMEIKMPEPELEIVWSKMLDINDAVWLPNSSAVITSYWGRRDRNDDIVIEVVKPERKTIIFNPEELNNFNLFVSDKQGRIYMYFWDNNEKRHVVRCNVNPEEKAISCDNVFVEKDRKIMEIEMFSDGSAIAFTETYTEAFTKTSTETYAEAFTRTFAKASIEAFIKNNVTCVKAMKIGEEKPYCITPPVDTLGNYIIPSGGIKISPDDKWLAFTVIRMGESGDEGITDDLYIVDLKND